MSKKLKTVNRIAKKIGIKEKILKSTRKNNKFMLIKNGKKIHFGHPDYEDFLDHKDKDRRKKYLSRARGIRDGNGKLTHKNKNSPNYYSINLLW